MGENASTIKCYLLPIWFSENAIHFWRNDGTFDDEDYILFYAEGLDTWNEESLTHSNLYDVKSYYYVTIKGETKGKEYAKWLSRQATAL
jgi:hypothetical protein